MQDFAGSTVVHYQGALAGLAGALILGPRIGKFGKDGRANPIPGHNIPFAVLFLPGAYFYAHGGSRRREAVILAGAAWVVSIAYFRGIATG